MAAAALPLVLGYMLETDGEERMQTLAQWKSAVWLASTCRELREESTAKRELAALQWVYSARFAMSAVVAAVRGLPHPLDDGFYSPRVDGAYELLKELGTLVVAEDKACAGLVEDEALARAATLLPFMLRARDRLRWVSKALDDEFGRYYRRFRFSPRSSPFNLPGRAALLLEEFEFHMRWRKNRPLWDAHFRPLGG